MRKNLNKYRYTFVYLTHKHWNKSGTGYKSIGCLYGFWFSTLKLKKILHSGPAGFEGARQCIILIFQTLWGVNATRPSRGICCAADSSRINKNKRVHLPLANVLTRRRFTVDVTLVGHGNVGDSCSKTARCSTVSGWWLPGLTGVWVWARVCDTPSGVPVSPWKTTEQQSQYI